MSELDYSKLQNSLVSIASELFRFQRVFEKAISKLEVDERTKYTSQFSWFSKKVNQALNESNIKLLSLDGQLYDPGMAVTPLNLDDFGSDEKLFISQTIEPIVMKNDKVLKIGTVVLGRIEK